MPPSQETFGAQNSDEEAVNRVLDELEQARPVAQEVQGAVQTQTDDLERASIAYFKRVLGKRDLSLKKIAIAREAVKRFEKAVTKARNELTRLEKELCEALAEQSDPDQAFEVVA